MAQGVVVPSACTQLRRPVNAYWFCAPPIIPAAASGCPASPEIQSLVAQPMTFHVIYHGRLLLLLQAWGIQGAVADVAWSQ